MIIDFCSYNVRGLNNKVPFVKDFLLNNNISLIGLIETRVQKNVAKIISTKISRSFQWSYNYSEHPGGRIWVGWNTFLWDISVIAQSSQHITCLATHRQYNVSFVISFIYGLHSGIDRRALWNDLIAVSRLIGSKAWVLSGDFNVCLDICEKQGGNVRWKTDMEEFKDFTMRLGLTDLSFVGDLFTWWDKNSQNPRFRKLDRVMVNSSWLHLFGSSTSEFLSRGLSDHCPAATCLGINKFNPPKPFVCFNFICDHPSFLDLVAKSWDTQVSGDPWFILTSKLKATKAALKVLNKKNGNVHTRVDETRKALSDFQSSRQFSTIVDDLNDEKNLILAYKSALEAEESLLQQKSRIQWLQLGDNNSKFFFNSCKNRWNTNKIFSITDANGAIQDTHQGISQVAVTYFQNLFGGKPQISPIPENITLPNLTQSQILYLSQPFTQKEILSTLKSMPKNKSPGPDGFSTEFFIKAWSVVGGDVERAIVYFFNTCHLPRIINSVAVALVPKIPNPSSMTDFRPISCCNTLYKCISKLLALRLQRIIPYLVSPYQSAFISGRSIGDNVMLVQSLCKDYHLNQGPPRCALKVDIHKAFDTLSWEFIFEVLKRMHFPEIFIDWIYACISSAMFSIKINGSLEGYFKGNSGLRQGDPLSPYLFVLAMEVLTQCIQLSTSSTDFKFHWRSKEVNLTHMVFADDIFLFCKGETNSVKFLKHGLDLFSDISGLKANWNKSNCFFANTSDDVKNQILQLTGFQCGSLPITYLGLPLITTKLKYQDCRPLLSKICFRIETWTSKFLSFAGRLILIRTVLFGILGYWSMFLFLPNHILKRINSMVFKFLWGGYYKPTGRCHHKVSWLDCCHPTLEGGLGIKNIYEWNKSAILFQFWRLVQPNASSIWVQWFQKSLLKNKGIWTAGLPYKCAWGVRKIFNCRDKAIEFIKYHIGRHSIFKFWHDPWIRQKPLLVQFDRMLVSNFESNLSAEIRDFQQNGNWVLPTSNYLDCVELRRRISEVQLNDSDYITWEGLRVDKVSISTVWNSIRHKAVQPSWHQYVWHSFSINKCSFIMWLALKDRLLTKDKMILFQMQVQPNCLLCSSDETTHHLFSDCPYFDLIRAACPVPFSADWNRCQQGDLFAPSTCEKWKYIGSLFLAVAVYLVWKERNFRLHNVGSRHGTHSVIITLKKMVREKLWSSAKFRKWAHQDASIISLLY